MIFTKLLSIRAFKQSSAYVEEASKLISHFFINENMSWKPHTDRIANKLSKYVGIINRLKRYLPQNILKMIYTSIIQSNLNYCILAWGYNCGRLKKLQKRAIRLITDSPYNSHTEPIFKQLNILQLEDMFKVNMLKWYYQFKNKKLPFYFNSFEFPTHENIHNYNTRNRRNVVSVVIQIINTAVVVNANNNNPIHV